MKRKDLNGKELIAVNAKDGLSAQLSIFNDCLQDEIRRETYLGGMRSVDESKERILGNAFSVYTQRLQAIEDDCLLSQRLATFKEARRVYEERNE